MSFILGADKKHYYNYFYLFSIIIGAISSLSIILNLIDGFFALMAIPTMIATIYLSPRVMKEAKLYFRKIKG